MERKYEMITAEWYKKDDEDWGYALINSDYEFVQEGFTYPTVEEAMKACESIWAWESIWKGYRLFDNGYIIQLEN